MTESSRTTSREFRTLLAPCLIGVGLSAAMLACAEPEEPARSAETVQPAAQPVSGVLYRTELSFVGRGAEPSLVHLRFDNRTDSTSIHLSYRGWFGGDE